MPPDTAPGRRGPWLAPYACQPQESRGRLHVEPESARRTPFQRDRDRVIHSTAFRRLKHKTQVFVFHEGDHYRTRLTHSLEVAQIARTLARALGLDEDLTEALALAHDFGHTPFGHAGEEALDACMKDWGGFDHNAQTLRILTALEQRYPAFDGLNLTWETLEGVVKHNGPLTGPHARPDRTVPGPILAYDARHSLALGTFPSAEAQAAALADDIAYNSHDLDDGLRAGLFGIDDVARLPLVGPSLADARRRWPGLDMSRAIHQTVSAVIGAMVEDVLTETAGRLAGDRIASAAAVRAHRQAIVAFSPAMQADVQAVRHFLFERMYRHHLVNCMTSKARRIVTQLFGLLFAEPELLPTDWRLRAGQGGEAGRSRAIADWIAGMTDNYALATHRKLFDPAAL
ncbi:MAG: deoxyguanosinetriphosphate triphosphohydrolase [Alphaproteobacteria bacterium]|nr:deoxyguanosinetriphosphate triphosphohydrolase [Alphaproteobacteria bacterium]